MALVLEVAGMVALITAAALVAPALGVLVLGLCLFGSGVWMDRG